MNQIVDFLMDNVSNLSSARSFANTLGSIKEKVNRTPYKQNTNGTQICKVTSTKIPGPNDDVGNINNYSYLKHEFKQSSKKEKDIIVVYNSLYKQPAWLPDYLSDYESVAEPFWIKMNRVTKLEITHT